MTTPAAQLQGLGIAQDGDPVLTAVAQPFTLPAEAPQARQLAADLGAALDRVAAVHNFTKGMGIAAPQIHISRAAAVIRPPGGDMVALFNPRVTGQSAETDGQYEGCLSFFDVRGLVPRPRSVEIRYQELDGTWHTTVLRDGTARLACHEIDHLQGVLYRARMRPGDILIPAGQHPGAGEPWSYLKGQP